MVVNPLKRAYLALESWFNLSFGSEWNPLYHLGTLSFFLFWVILITGIYLFIPFHGSIDGAWASVEYMTRDQWYAAGVMRSLHRYASDAVLVTVLLHMFREFASGRYRGFRWFSWVTGVPTLWLLIILGITGYWLVWDQIAQYVAIGSARLMDGLPLLSGAMTRNFVAGEMTDRFFILIEFLHLLGLPLFLVVLLWIHVKRLSNVSINPPVGLAIGTFCALLALSFARPALSHPPADLTTMPFTLNLDWYYLNVYPLLDKWTAGQTWLMTSSVTVLIMLLPWIPPRKTGQAAVVDLDNCNGCGLCFNDCPFDAISVQARTDGARYEHEVVVDPSQCAACGICVGSCPASNPFRKARTELHTGIDMPQFRAGELRTQVREAAGTLQGDAGILVFGCEHGVDIQQADTGDTRAVKLFCVGMLPPTMVEYAIRHGARGVMITGCRESDCFYRFGNRWTRQRFSGDRNPILRARVDRRTVLVEGGAPVDGSKFYSQLEAFRSRLRALEGGSGSYGTGGPPAAEDSQ